jgi:hypothetical protein
MTVCGFRGNEPQINTDEHRYEPVKDYMGLFVHLLFFVIGLNNPIHRKVRKERKAKLHCRIRMTWIGQIFTDRCASAQSVFHHVCPSLKNPESETELSEFICVNPWFFHDVDFQNYDALRHESTSINYILPLEGV